MSRLHLSLGAVLASSLLLAACTRPSAPSPKATRSGADIVAAIRAAGQQEKSAIEVAPLRDPGVQQLLDEARRDSAARQYQAAAAKLDHAIKLSPQSPDLLQQRAELAVRLGDYAAAESLARRSWALGPKLGSLCARNWQTVLEMRRIAKDPTGVESARQSLAQCHVAGPVRM